MDEDRGFPYRFFVVTFAWSWLMWLPLLLAGAGIIPLGKNLLSALTVPSISLGAFGPAAGAFYSLRTLRGEEVGMADQNERESEERHEDLYESTMAPGAARYEASHWPSRRSNRLTPSVRE